MTTTNIKSVTAGDKYIGHRIRQARNEALMTQTKLGEALGVTFQQIQKYENGVNRIGGARFEVIAKALKKPVHWFFANGGGEEKPDLAMVKFLATKDGHLLARNFSLLSQTDRNLVVDLAMRLAAKGRKS